jgi:hypothetical protein
MQDELNDAPAQSDTWFNNMQSANTLVADSLDLLQLRELAASEAGVNRTELEKLYADSYWMTGEPRYHLLWRLSQLERKCLALERIAHEVSQDVEELECSRTHVSELTLQAVQLRQEARLLLNAARRADNAQRKRPGGSGSSGRRYPHFAGV